MSSTTNADKISIEGETERFSSVWFSNWFDVTYSPDSKLYSMATNAALGGEFRQTMNLTTLPESTFSLESDGCRNIKRTSDASKRDIIIHRDTTAPEVTYLTIDGEPEATGQPHYYTQGDLVTMVYHP